MLACLGLNMKCVMPLVMVEARISVGSLGGQIGKDASQPHTLKHKLSSVFEQRAWRRNRKWAGAVNSEIIINQVLLH